MQERRSREADEPGVKGVRKIAIASAAIVVVALLLPATALGGVTKVTWPVAIRVAAAADTENHISVTYRAWGSDGFANYIHDSAGVFTKVVDAPTCYPNGPREVLCPDGTATSGNRGGGNEFVVYLRDGDDVFRAGSHGNVGEFSVYGGSGNDFLFGHNDPSCTTGFETEPGECVFPEDLLYGGRGKDDLLGGEGPDSLFGGPGADKLTGDDPRKPHDREDQDSLVGGSGNDRLNGGPGKDRYYGGSGNDRINARDGIREKVDCGTGRDRAKVDRRDRVRHCEKVLRG
jgi:Ca2+-binding RTX toxin-like protein